MNMVVESDLPELLCQVKFPLYNAMLVSSRHIMLGGGGGAAKTGVHNGFVSQQGHIVRNIIVGSLYLVIKVCSLL